MSAPKRILIVRLGAMGDILHAMPAAAALRAIFPECEIGWVIESRWSELLRSSTNARALSDEQPLVNFVHLVDTRKWRKNLLSESNRKQALAALREVRQKKYDIAIDFQGAIKSAVVAKLSSAPVRYGFTDPWEKPASLLYSSRMRVAATHVVERNVEMVKAIGHGITNPDAGSARELLPVDDEAWVEKKRAELGLSRAFAILNPGAGWGAKQWPVERYAEVARAISKEGVRSLVNYGQGEEELAYQVEQQSDGYAMATRFTISELIAVTRRASLFVGGDTGPLHLAAALKVPVVALFGPTDPTRTGPYGTRSIVLRDPTSVTSHKRNRETEAGLKNITSEQVIAAARQLLAEGAPA